jgi:hypothetical protein
MAVLEPRYSMEEFARRGEEIYRRDIKPQLQAEHLGKFIVIDIETGMWEMDPDGLTASERLLSRNAMAQMWLIRAGYEAAHSIGGTLRRERE